MQAIINHAAPNVVPGTQFNTQRFSELFSWASALSADAARTSLDPNQYGLLVSFDGKSSFDLEKIGQQIILRRCAAITPGGRIIGIFEEHTPILEINLDDYQLDPGEYYQLFVEVHGTERNAFGPTTEELPMRPQFSMPAYRLHVQFSNQTIGRWADGLPIGNLFFDSGEWKLMTFIPPTAHIGAHKIIRKKYTEYKEAVNAMLTSMPGIIRQTDSFRDKAMIELREFTMQCGSFLSNQKPIIDALTETGQPFSLLKTWMAFANLMAFQLDCLTDRPGFYNLLYQNTKSVNGVMFTTNRLDQALFELTNQNYNHGSILSTIQAIDEFLSIVVPMFKALGNGTMRPIGNNYEEVYKAPTVIPQAKVSTNQSHITW